MSRGFAGTRFRLVGLLALVVLPLVLFAGRQAVGHRDQTIAHLREDLLRLARTIAYDQEQITASTRQLLGVLAQVDSLRGDDNAACSRVMRRAAAENPQYTVFAKATPGGDILCSSRDSGQTLNIADGASFQGVLRDKAFHAGGYRIGQFSGKPVVAFSAPIFDERNDFAGIVTTGLDLAWVNRLLAEIDLPPKVTLTLIDGKGTVLARQPAADSWIGRSVAGSDLLRRISLEDSAVVEVQGLEGQLILAGFARVHGLGDGFHAVVGIPVRDAVAAVDRELYSGLLILTAIVVLSLALAGVVSRRLILNWVERLSQATERLAAGDLTARAGPPYDNSELGRLAHDYDQMAALLQQNSGESRRIQQDLADSEARLRAILDNIIDGVVAVDEKGLIQSFNRSAERIFGYAADSAIGRNVKLLMPAPHSANHDQYIENYLRNGQAKIIGVGREVEGRRSDGSVFPMDLGITELTFGGRRFFLGLVRDISERRKVDQMKAEFISTVSHELRTPLTAIRASLSLVNSGALGDVPPEAKELTDIAQQSAERLVRLINDILDMERINSDVLTLDVKLLALDEVIERAVSDNRSYGDHYRIGLRVVSTLPGARLLADEDRLIQVLTNLLSNAVKFSPQGGEVTIGAAAMEAGWMRISVTDSGPGIPEEFRSRIFGKFAQADSSDTKAKGGAGLGLSISKGIVERLGGRIGFTTRIGRGSVFYVDLPLCPDQAGTMPPAAGDTRPAVLICEDDGDVAKLLALLLDRAGFATVIAADAAQALSLLERHRFNAMTLDLRLPDRDGIAVIQELRARPETHGLPVIVVSAVADERKQGLYGEAFGIIDWIGKPIDEKRLVAAVMLAARERPSLLPRILHVEDDAMIVAVVAKLLIGIAEVTAVASLSEALTMAGQDDFDLAILDIGLPDGCGLDVVPRLKTRSGRGIPVVVFSAQDDVPESCLAQVAATLVKSRATNQQLIETIRALIPCRSEEVG